MKKLFILVLLLFMVGCTSQTTIEETTTTNQDSQYVSSTEFEYLDLGTIEASYNLQNLNDFYIVIADLGLVHELEVVADEITISDYHIDENKLFISHDYLVGLSNSNDEIEIELYTSNGKLEIELNFQDSAVPSIISENEVIFQGNDIEFVLDYAGGEFVEIDGSDISTNDYTLVDNILTIDSDFIQDLFDAEPSRNNVVLSVQLRNDDNVVIVYIVITRN